MFIVVFLLISVLGTGRNLQAAGKVHDVIIIGAGAAGIGAAVTLT